MVFSELEGLKSSKKEKTSQNAEEATQFIIQNNIRFLTTSGKLLAGKFNPQLVKPLKMTPLVAEIFIFF